MSDINVQEITKQIKLNDEIEYITSINNIIDNLTISARDATTIITIKNSLVKLASSLGAKNNAISALDQYFNERAIAPAAPIVNKPKS